MPWVKFDDQYPISRKLAGLSDAAFRLDVEGILWCARNLTDANVPRTQLESVSNAPRTSRKWRANLLRTVAELVRENRWHAPGHDCPKCPQPIDGWVIHDYLDYQPSKDDVLRERAAKAERQRRWMESKKGGRDASNRNKAGGSPGNTSDAPEDALLTPTPPRPAPPRKGGEGTASPPATATAAKAAEAGGDGRAEDQNPDAPNPPPSTSTRPVPPGERRAHLAAQARAAAANNRPDPRHRAAAVLDIAGQPPRGTRTVAQLLADIGADSPPRPAIREGLGLCVRCAADGTTTVAADPVAGSLCTAHTASNASPKQEDPPADQPEPTPRDTP